MILIKCDICGKRHQPGVCEGAVKNAPRVSVKSSEPLLKPPFKELTPGEFKAEFNAYMRDYMRKKRAMLKSLKKARNQPINEITALMRGSEVDGKTVVRKKRAKDKEKQ